MCTLDRAALYRELMAQEEAEGSTSRHLSFLDRGLDSSPFESDAPAIATRLARPLTGPDGDGGEAMPTRGVMPKSIGSAALSGLDPTIKSACVVVVRSSRGEPGVAWHGRNATANAQFWSATKIIQAFNLVSLVNEQHPDLEIDQMLLGPAAGAGPTVQVPQLLKEIVSYEKGVPRSNAGAETLGRFLKRQEREAMVEQHTGHDVTFRGAYGDGSLIARPKLVTRDGQVVAVGPAALGEPGANLVSAYDMVRMVAMAAWHPHLTTSRSIAGARWHSLAVVLKAMGHDSARFVDVAFEKLGLMGSVSDVVIATKLGFGISSASKLAQMTYVGALQFTDRRHSPPVTRRACFALRGEHASAVALDARMAVEVTDLVRLLANGSL
ncbi:MAG: hypothetical protein HY815_14535 [Candidatus Riflebacteria bacterium]|nr:hypothetical protein [Candidatus Riflebacteria bacterium]